MKIRRLLCLILVVSLIFSFSSIAVAEDSQDESVQNEVIEDIQEQSREVSEDIDGLLGTNNENEQEVPVVEEQEEIINTETSIVEEETEPIVNQPSQENTDGSHTNEENNTDEILALKEELEDKEREIEELNQIINDLRENQQPKKLAAPMMLGESPSNSQNTITVSYTGEGTEAYTVSVPASLAPGESGDIVLEGTWASNRIVTVSADTSVVLTNNLNAAEQKELAVSFEGIELAGNNMQISSTSNVISIADISNVLFGTWEGQIEYEVVIESILPKTISIYSVDDLMDVINGNTAVNPCDTIEICSSLVLGSEVEELRFPTCENIRFNAAIQGDNARLYFTNSNIEYLCYDTMYGGLYLTDSTLNSGTLNAYGSAGNIPTILLVDSVIRDYTFNSQNGIIDVIGNCRIEQSMMNHTKTKHFIEINSNTNLEMVFNYFNGGVTDMYYESTREFVYSQVYGYNIVNSSLIVDGTPIELYPMHTEEPIPVID